MTVWDAILLIAAIAGGIVIIGLAGIGLVVLLICRKAIKDSGSLDDLEQKVKRKDD